MHHFDDTIYRSQIRSRSDTEARRLTAGLPLLATIPTTHAMAEARLVLPSSKSVADAVGLMEAAGVSGAPVVDAAGRFEGTVALAELAEAPDQASRVGDLADAGAPAIVAAEAASIPRSNRSPRLHMSWVSVLDDDRRVVGVLSISDLVASYRRELFASAQRVSALGAASGAFELCVGEDSGLAGHTLRTAELPEGSLVTSIARNGEVLTPSGDVVLKAGDRLSLLG